MTRRYWPGPDRVEKILCSLFWRNSEVFKHIGAQDAADALLALRQLSSILCSCEINYEIDTSGRLKVRMDDTVSRVEKRAEYFLKKFISARSSDSWLYYCRDRGEENPSMAACE